jgi:hypothetical protein
MSIVYHGTWETGFSLVDVSLSVRRLSVQGLDWVSACTCSLDCHKRDVSINLKLLSVYLDAERHGILAYWTIGWYEPLFFFLQSTCFPCSNICAVVLFAVVRRRGIDCTWSHYLYTSAAWGQVYWTSNIIATVCFTKRRPISHAIHINIIRSQAL